MKMLYYNSISRGRRILYRMIPEAVFPVIFSLISKRGRQWLRHGGFARSVQLFQPVDEQGQPLPWMPYCVSRLLKERLRQDLDVLEFGAGYSTLFLMSRVRSVLAVEDKEGWLRQLRPQVAGNVRLQSAPRTPIEAYCGAVPPGSRFDLISIDGPHRIECLQRAWPMLTPRGVILFDNSNRLQFADAFVLARQNDFRALSLEGPKPGRIGIFESTFFYRNDNCLGI